MSSLGRTLAVATSMDGTRVLVPKAAGEQETSVWALPGVSTLGTESMRKGCSRTTSSPGR